MSSTGVPESLAQVRGLMTATVAALRGISTIAHQAPNDELGAVVGEIGELIAFGTGALVSMTAEAEQRGVVAESQAASTAAWVRDQAWHLQTAGSAVVAKCAVILQRHDLDVLADAVRSADVTPAVAVTVAAEFDKLAPDLADGAADVVLDAMIEVGAEHGVGQVCRLRELLLARYGKDGAFQDEQDARRRYVNLSVAREETGIFHYDVALDAEGKAVLEAAIGPLSAPQPSSDGELDMRPVGRRRGEALVEVCRRATAAGGQISSATKASVYVTINLGELQARAGAATAIGSLDGGALLGPETARKLACDAGIIPVVLGSDGEILDMGRTQRLFTSGQVKALWLRDRHCTFTGCDAPAHWCHAHHLWHWIDGGPTDLANAALLCGRHPPHVRESVARVGPDRAPRSTRRHRRRRPSPLGPKTGLLPTTFDRKCRLTLGPCDSSARIAACS